MLIFRPIRWNFGLIVLRFNCLRFSASNCNDVIGREQEVMGSNPARAKSSRIAMLLRVAWDDNFDPLN
jgi:hypothetical protein